MHCFHTWEKTHLGMSENGVQTPNEIAIFHRDHDQQNHWVQWGLANIFRSKPISEYPIYPLVNHHFSWVNQHFSWVFRQTPPVFVPKNPPVLNAEWPPLHQPGPSEEAPRPPNRRGCGELLGDQMGFFGWKSWDNIWKYHGNIMGKLNMVSMVLWYFFEGKSLETVW